MITMMVLPTTRRDPELAEGELRVLLEGLLQAGDHGRLVETLVGLYGELSRENDRLRLRILELTRRVHGRSSEKIDPNALRKALEELREREFAQQAADQPEAAADEPAAPKPSPPKAPAKPRKPHPGRTPLPTHLPREERRHALAEADRLCECCEQPKHRIREEVAEHLEYVPSRFYVIRDVTEVYGCSCGFSKPVAAELPSRVIDGGLPEPGLLAHVVILKYEDHQPLNRQSKIFAREGVTLSPNTLMEWIRAAAQTLQPLARRIHKRVLRSWVIQSDDTGLLVLDADKPQGARKGHLWANVGDGRLASYHYSPDWKHEHPASFLKGCAGYLQTDGYKGYDALTGGPALAIRVGCFMHVRRYFLKAFKAKAIDAAIPIDIIQRLYRIERASKEAGEDADARLARRREFSAPLLDELDAWLAKHDGRYEPKSPLGKAITYLKGQRGTLGVFLLDGQLELDNGAVERALRGIAVGRHNWLFAGSDAGAERAAILYTVITSAKLHGLEPYAYLRDVLAKLGAGWPNRRLDELMPDRWGREQGIAPPPLLLTELTEAT